MNSFKDWLKEIPGQISLTTKIILLAGVIMILYGYLCRWLNIYFFWESSTIGWFVLFVGVIFLMRTRFKVKKGEKRNTVPEIIVIVCIVFVILFQTLLLCIVPLTGAYPAAKEYLTNSKEIQSEIGAVQDFWLESVGGLHLTKDSSGKHGDATINLVVKGQNGYLDLTVVVTKAADGPWTVESVE